LAIFRFNKNLYKT